jgi:hypothetical protein
MHAFLVIDLIEVKKKPSDDTDVVIYFDSFDTAVPDLPLPKIHATRALAYLLSSPALSSAEARGRRFRPTEIGSWRAGVQFETPAYKLYFQASK